MPKPCNSFTSCASLFAIVLAAVYWLAVAIYLSG
jgi:hypothetical protein